MYPAITDVSTHAQMQDDQLCQADHQRTVFFGIPAPETPPRVVGPYSAEDCANDAEKEPEAQGAVDHSGQALVVAGVGLLDAKELGKDPYVSDRRCQESRRITEGHRGDVGR